MPDSSPPTLYPAPRRLREMAVGERPQERLEKHGAAYLNDTELLAMLVRSGNKNCDVISLSARLIDEAGSLSGLVGWSAEDFQRIKGIGKVKSLQLLAVMEIAKRVLVQQKGDCPAFNAPELVFDHIAPVAAGLAVEKFWVLCLNRKHALIRRTEITSGTASSSLVHPREVFREAIRLSASAIIAVHNHPSGDPSPSSADIQVTRQLREASRTVGIDLLDHIIAGTPNRDPQGRGFYSFREAGLI